jgi:spoIIIJ-associated protein
MDQELEITAKSEAEAIEKALEELDLAADQVETEVETLGKNSKGFLGLVGPKEKRFLVKVKTKEDVAEEEQDKLEKIGPAAEGFLGQIFELMKISAKTRIVEEDAETLKIDIEGEDLGILIGRRGQTLDALQYLLNIVVNRGARTPKRVALDIEGYRSRRMSELEELAKRIAEQVAENKMTIALRPMSPYERRIIHLALQDNKDVETVSEGEEPERKVLIIPKD